MGEWDRVVWRAKGAAPTGHGHMDKTTWTGSKGQGQRDGQLDIVNKTMDWANRAGPLGHSQNDMASWTNSTKSTAML